MLAVTQSSGIDVDQPFQITERADDIACSAKGIDMAGGRFPRPWRFEPTPGGYRVIDANDLLLAHVYGEPPNAVATSPNGLTDDESRRIAKLMSLALIAASPIQPGELPLPCRSSVVG
jgi:hypothetical protein